MANPLRKLSIRTKLTWISITLLVIPWFGYQYVQEMRGFLIQGQQDALLLSASGIATVLNERPELFDPFTGVPQLLGDNNNPVAYQLTGFAQIDGELKEWDTIKQYASHYTGNVANLCLPEDDPDDLSLTHNMGHYEQYLYAYFNVTDNRVLFRDPSRLQLDTSDQIRILLETHDKQLERYVLIADAPGRMSVYQVDENWQLALEGGADIQTFTASLQTNNFGYTVELRVPKSEIGSAGKIGFYVIDVDNQETRAIDNVLATSPQRFDNEPSQIVLTSPEITKILSGLDRPKSKIWILDDQQRVRAVVGELTTAALESELESETPDIDTTLLGRISRVIENQFDRLFSRPAKTFTDIEDDIGQRTETIFAKAVGGDTIVGKRKSLDGKAEIIIAGHPISIGNNVLGAVVVEQSSHTILSLHYRLVRSMTVLTIAVFFFVLAMLFIFSWRLIVRIRRLFNTTEQAITPQGRVIDVKIPKRTYPNDELGDLGRSITNMLKRLSGYTHYLERMPDTLAHELSNPLNVVTSSLQLLETGNPQLHDNKHIKRARNGVQRLRAILTNLTEAANLEEAMQHASKKRFNASDFLSEVVEGYRFSFPQYQFILDIPEHAIFIGASSDHMAEMMDKLIDNAMQFCKDNTPITVHLKSVDHYCVISVANQGPKIPENLKDRLFDPMVSYGKTNASQSHLGLGLFVVRLITEYHQGNAWAENLADDSGVVVSARIPLYELDFI